MRGQPLRLDKGFRVIAGHYKPHLLLLFLPTTVSIQGQERVRQLSLL